MRSRLERLGRFLLPMSLGTPTMAQVEGPVPSPIADSGHTCRPRGTDRFIGKVGSPMMGSAIKTVTHAAILRWGRPGVMLTMDYREDRVTVYVNPKGRIVRINCG